MFGVMEKLDELDAKDYTPHKKDDNSIAISKQPPTFLDKVMDSNLSDFDNSDEDLASLLADDDDDDDDIFAKKAFSGSPKKKPNSGPELSPKKSTSDLKSKNIQNSNADINKQESKPALSKSSSREMSDTDAAAANEFLFDSSLPSFLKDTKKSPVKKSINNRTSEESHNESKYLDELGFTHLSSETALSKSHRSSSLKSKASLSEDGDISEDDDILKSLESDVKTPSSPRKRSGSFFDDFLKTLSPKHSPQKSSYDSSKKLDGNEKEFIEEDIFGKYTSAEPKKNITSPKQSTPEKRKESLQKQVSFKGLHDSLPDNGDTKKEKTSVSPKIQPEKSEPEPKLLNKSVPKPKRSERMGATKTDDTDWLTFFKESPKKSKKPPETDIKSKKDISEEREVFSSDFKLSANRRKSSTAEWLGLSASNITSESDAVITEKGKVLNKNTLELDEPLKVSRPHTTGSSIYLTQKEGQSDDLSWLGKDSKKDSFEKKKRSPITTTETANDADIFSDGNKLSESKDSKLVLKTHHPEPKISSPIPESHEKQEVINQSHMIKATNNVQTFPSEMLIGDNKSNMSSVTQNIPRYMEDVQGIANQPRIITEQGFLSNNGSNDYTLQILIKNHALERDQLIKSNEALKLMYEERIKTIENLHKDQMKSIEETFKSQESKMKLEIGERIQIYEEKLNTLTNEKFLLEKDYKEKLDVIKKENSQEVQRLKDLHSQSIISMKHDHEEALNRLNRLKEQEIEAVLSTQSHSRSLQHLTDQLEARASELASLQTKVEERNQATLREKQALLEAKERDLKNLQIRLQKQLEDGDEERTRLQQLVLRLESRLQKCTTEGEEDRWEVQQLKTRLSVQQKHLDEEYKLNLQQVEKEKEKLRLAQDSLLHEQKTVLLQLAQERQQLMREKVDIESLAKKTKEEEVKFNVKKMKEESFIERQKMFIQQEESRLSFEKANIKQEMELLERERDTLQVEKQMLKSEKMKFNDFTFKIKRKESEIEDLAASASEEREKAWAEHASALKIKSEQQSRVQEIAQKMQILMEKEQQISVEKEKLAQENLELENKKNSMLCNKCKLSLGFPFSAPPTGVNTVAVNAISSPVTTYPQINRISNQMPPSHIDPSLLVWYITAQKDREYLQEELSFLKSLKESSKPSKKM